MDNRMNKFNYIVEQTKSGDKTIQVNGLYLHSRYNPVKEAEKIVEKHYVKGRLFILFGLGLGYLVKAFEKFIDPEYDDLFIIEPSAELFNIHSRIVDFNDILKQSYITFCVEPQKDLVYRCLAQLMDKHGGKIVFIDSPNYKNLFEEEHIEFLKQVRELSYLNIVNINTIFAWSKNWQENLLSNLYTAMEATPFAKLTENKLNCPAILVSGGPSLTKQLPLLKEIRDRALIICAGSTINSLLKHGIKPHILVVVDGAEINFTHYKDVEEIHAIPLFYPLIVYKEIPSYHKGHQVVFNLHKDELSKTINNIFKEELGYVNGGGSVATFGLSIAKQLTNGPICLIGQDLAFTNFQTHADGNRLGKQLNKEELLKSKKYLKVKGFYGDEVITNYSFYSMKQTFEELIKSFSDCEIYNATEGGVYIEGAKHIRFVDFIEQYCVESAVQELNDLNHQIIYNKFNKRTVKESLSNFVNSSIENIEKVINSSKDALSYMEHVHSSEDLIQISNELDQIEEKLKSYLEKDLLQYLFMTTTFRVLYQFEFDESSLIEKTRFLYKSIHDLCEQARCWLKDLNDKLKTM